MFRSPSVAALLFTNVSILFITSSAVVVALFLKELVRLNILSKEFDQVLERSGVYKRERCQKYLFSENTSRTA